MLEFHNTVLGRHFLEHDFPALVKAIKELTVELRRFNDSVESVRDGSEKED